MLTVTDGMWSAYRRNFLPELKTDAAQHLFCALVAIFPSYRTLTMTAESIEVDGPHWFDVLPFTHL